MAPPSPTAAPPRPPFAWGLVEVWAERLARSCVLLAAHGGVTPIPPVPAAAVKGDLQLSPSRVLFCVMSTCNGLGWRSGVGGGRASVAPSLTPMMAPTGPRGVGQWQTTRGPLGGCVGLPLTRHVARLVLNAPSLGPCPARGVSRAPCWHARTWPRTPGSSRCGWTGRNARCLHAPAACLAPRAPPPACPAR